MVPADVGIVGSNGAEGWALDDGQLRMSWGGWLGNAEFVGLSAGPSDIVAVPESRFNVISRRVCIIERCVSPNTFWFNDDFGQIIEPLSFSNAGIWSTTAVAGVIASRLSVPLHARLFVGR